MSWGNKIINEKKINSKLVKLLMGLFSFRVNAVGDREDSEPNIKAEGH